MACCIREQWSIVMKRACIVFLGASVLAWASRVWGEDEIPPVVQIKEDAVAGEFYGTPVSMDNYRFAKTAVLIFGNRWGSDPKTPEELEAKVWEDLLLSYEAFQRDIGVTDSEVEEEVSKILKSEKVPFDWQKDRPAYEQWTKTRMNIPVALFENLLKHLIQLQKLRDEVRKGFQPSVTEEEAFAEYLNEYNTLGVEFVHFEELDKAQEFYKNNSRASYWDKQIKKNPKFTVRPGFVSLECLIELWKIPREDVYAMLKQDIGSFYRPTPMYRGYGVFRILEKRMAQEDQFPERRASYFDQIRQKKQYEELNTWLEKLKKESGLRTFMRPEGMGSLTQPQPRDAGQTP